MLTRKEAVNQMIENRQKIISKEIDDFLELVTDKIQIAVNQGLGEVSINIEEFDDNSLDSLIKYIKYKGYRVYTYYDPILADVDYIRKIHKLKIQWDLPWWRRIF